MIRTATTDLDGLADLLITRTRTILWIALLVGLAFLAVEVVVAPRLAAPFVVKCIGASLTGVALVLVHASWAVRHALALSVMIIGAAYVLTAVSGIVSPTREYATTAVLFVAAALTTATLLPWGAAMQSVTVVGAMLLLVAAVVWAGGDAQVFTADPAVAVGLGLSLSVLTAYEMQRHRLLSMRELAARRRAEQALRALNADLERRVVERTRELQDANERLQALSLHLESVREDEQGRVAREVHDELGQLLTALKIDLDLLPRRLHALSNPAAAQAVREKLTAMSQLAHGMIQSVRRIAAELRPSMLDDLGLPAAMAWQVRDFEHRYGVHSSFTCEPLDVTLDPTYATALFRITQEALANVALHAQASHVAVTLRYDHGYAVLEVSDDGCGIGADALRSPESLGLLAIRARARLLGGSADIESAPGHGTTVHVRIPDVGVEQQPVLS